MSSGAATAGPLMYCTTCGKPIQSGARFCTACGSTVGLGQSPTIAASSVAGKGLFVEALKLGLAKGSGIPAMPLLQKALALGLSPEDQVEAHFSLGGGYREIFGNSGLSWQKMVETNEFKQCKVEIEKAIELDRMGSFGFFSEPLNIGRLRQLDVMYTLEARAK